ncbi:cytochrome P450 [Alcaligenes faecalis]|uniref:cytochrome P450 n=1 Tax=Alcaligenes faecalis TaxID=511 RepID=UPI001C83098B|nr:cytochrome P450 [Alcaligenes faecalis]MBX6965460.1 cytochrome P450 [Providencia rettgeri]MBX7030837.1 cytochrome P450 [Alcaligenes faecalis]
MFGDFNLASPYAAYAGLRQGPPVVWDADFCGGAWLVHRHCDVQAALRNPDLSVRRVGGWVAQAGAAPSPRLQAFKGLMARTLVFLDRPRHTRVRRVVNAGFSAKGLESLHGTIKNRTAQIHRGLKDKLRDGSADLVDEVCRPLPALVMMDVLGLQQLPLSVFQTWSEQLARFIGQATPDLPLLKDTQDALLDMADFLGDSTNLQEGGLAWRLLHDEQLSLQGRRERLAQSCMLLFAGYETSRHLLSSLFQTLLGDSIKLQDLLSNPQKIPAAIKEVLRYDSPIQYTARRLMQDQHWHGQHLRKGQLLLLLLGAANRDPEVFANPDELDFSRDNQAELSMGHGIHHCLGAGLVQLEAKLLLEQFLPLLPRLQLAQGERIQLPAYRGWNRLPVQYRATQS